MSDQDGFDTRLTARFERERRQVPADAFVAATMRKVRAARRRRDAIRVGLRAAALLAAVAGSPWLIAGGVRLNAALQSSFTWTLGLPVAWILGVLAIVVVVAMRVRRR
jgi:hypothetical protein